MHGDGKTHGARSVVILRGLQEREEVFPPSPASACETPLLSLLLASETEGPAERDCLSHQDDVGERDPEPDGCAVGERLEPEQALVGGLDEPAFMVSEPMQHVHVCEFMPRTPAVVLQKPSCCCWAHCAGSRSTSAALPSLLWSVTLCSGSRDSKICAHACGRTSMLAWREL